MRFMVESTRHSIGTHDDKAGSGRGLTRQENIVHSIRHLIKDWCEAEDTYPGRWVTYHLKRLH